LAIAIGIFPVPIIAVVLMVGSDRGRSKGLAFVLAWGVGLTAVGTMVLLVAGVAEAGHAGETAAWVNGLLLILGLLLLVAAVQQWWSRPRAPTCSGFWGDVRSGGDHLGAALARSWLTLSGDRHEGSRNLLRGGAAGTWPTQQLS